MIVAFAYAMRPRATTPAPSLAGRPAPAFVLPLFDGGVLSSGELRGNVVVVNFWASWCVPCRDEAPILQALWQSARRAGLVVVGVNVWDREADARAFMRHYGLTFPTGPDRDGRVAVAFGVRGIPETFVVDRAGRIVHRFAGPLDPARLREVLDPLGVAP
ncbi:MAG: redoxin domain-containing protein [Armatimonadota bacterium]|nr:redoxin domain-containing protein [Armatimonadota bacterium]